MATRFFFALLVTSLLAATAAASASAASASSTVWLCKPGLASNPCTDSVRTTAIKANGSQSPEQVKTTANPPIDCFYVYPTVSQQKTGNSDLTITSAETGVAKSQASRFSTKCRVFAPMYRQLTLARLFGTATSAGDGELAYNDVKAAWQEYLTRYNKGRGVVLIGHSQGSFTLTRLIAAEIDPKASVRSRLISALMIGGGVLVATGKDVGGSFKSIPACRKTSQTGCVVAYNTFNQQPPANSLFGRSAQAGKEVLCTNPAALARGASGKAQIYVQTSQLGFGGPPLAPTPWVSMAGLYTTRCASGGGANWLQATDVGGQSDKRPRFGTPLGQSWGLHIVDVNIVLGNLLDLVGHQSTAWLARSR